MLRRLKESHEWLKLLLSKPPVPSEFAEISQKCLPRIADGEGHGSFNQSHIAQQLARYAKSRRGSEAQQSPVVEVSEFDLKSHEGPMQKTVHHLQTTLRGIQTGRASPGMLDTIRVEAYGDRVPLKGLASVSVRDRQTLAISVYDVSIIGAVEKGVSLSSLNLNPTVEDNEILVHVPRLTKETVIAMQKLVKKEGESAKLSVRNVRRDILDAAKKISSTDDRKRLEKQVQALTDKYIREVDHLTDHKEKDLNNAI